MRQFFWLLFWLFAVGGLAMTGRVIWSDLFPTPDRIGPDGFARIQDGMTLADVEAVLGKLGDYGARFEGPTPAEVRAYAGITPVGAAEYRSLPFWHDRFWWYGPHYWVEVTTDQITNRVAAKQIYHWHSNKPSLWQRIRKTLHL